MVDKRSSEQMDNLRERLYARGETPRPHNRVSLKKPAVVDTPKSDIVRPPVIAAAPPLVPPVSPAESAYDDYYEEPKGRNYRLIIVIVAVAFFLLSVLASTIYLMMGQNTVSGNNISLSISGPFTVGGGDLLDMQIGVTNQNAVAIESATLVIQYPPGTRSAEDSGDDKYSERLNLDSGIASGETRNIPIKVRVFGEENQEAEVKVTIEYRVAGSGATFSKEATPHRFKISHAPVVLKIEAEEAISSGQETTVKLTVTSNSASPVRDLLVEAEYPAGFDFSGSTPAPVSGRNVWRIDELAPEESTSIEITGVIVGTKAENYVLRFSVGVGGERDPNDLSSVLAVGEAEFTLEDPFLAMKIRVDNDEAESVSIAPGDQTTVFIEVTNTLETPVYDAIVEIKLSGNALSGTDVIASPGYYDANTRTVRFDSSAVSGFRRMSSGATESFTFSLTPAASGLESPQVVLDVSAGARRVSQTGARELISGTHKRTIRVQSQPTISGEVVGAEGGPVPPVAGETTTYEVEWTVTNSANSISGAVVTSVLPSYVEWTGETGGSGAWSYNPATRTIEWRAGNLNAGSNTTGTFEVDFLPSESLAGRTPTLVEAAHLRSQDNFTGTLLRHSSGSLTTEIAGERNSGVVQD